MLSKSAYIGGIIAGNVMTFGGIIAAIYINPLIIMLACGGVVITTLCLTACSVKRFHEENPLKDDVSSFKDKKMVGITFDEIMLKLNTLEPKNFVKKDDLNKIEKEKKEKSPVLAQNFLENILENRVFFKFNKTPTQSSFVAFEEKLNRPFSKLAAGSEMRGDAEQGTEVYTPLHEHSSTVSQSQFAVAIEFETRSNDSTPGRNQEVTVEQAVEEAPDNQIKLV